MGQCGCADGFGDYKMRGEKGWYVIQLYPGCNDCDTPLGIELYYYADDDHLLDCIEKVPDITAKLQREATNGNCLALAMFSRHDLIEEPALKEIADPSEYASVQDLVSDLGNAIRQAAVTTINRTLKETKVH